MTKMQESDAKVKSAILKKIMKRSIKSLIG